MGAAAASERGGFPPAASVSLTTNEAEVHQLQNRHWIRIPSRLLAWSLLHSSADRRRFTARRTAAGCRPLSIVTGMSMYFAMAEMTACQTILEFAIDLPSESKPE